MKALKIAKRIAGGWTDRQPNKQEFNCDDCGAALWVAPDGKSIYCDNLSNEHGGTEVPEMKLKVPYIKPNSPKSEKETA